VFGVIGILAALQDRERSGIGQFVDVAMLDSQIALLENAFVRYFATGVSPGPQGSSHPVVTPFQAFATRDGYLVVAVSPDSAWPVFCRVIGREDLLADPRYENNNSRTEHRETLIESLAPTLRERPTAEWLTRFEANGILCGPVNTIADAAADPQVQAREMVVEVPLPSGEPARVVNHPVKFSRTPTDVRAGPPALGQHTDAVLRDWLGLSPDAIADLRADGAV
jgi:CoA:oxalate CoA-transferase